MDDQLCGDLTNGCGKRERRPGSGLSASDVERLDPTRSKLASIIENEIIPRLMLSHRVTSAPRLPTPQESRGSVVDQMVRLVLARDGEPVYAFVERLVADGMSRDSLLLDVLAPVARRLGEMWEADECDFVDVTAGLSRLHTILRETGPASGAGRVDPQEGRHVLLTAAPGEAHTFGLAMVESFFRAAGWEVTCGPEVDAVEAVSRRSYGVVGISLSSEVHLPGLASLIRGLRRSSRNQALGIMVGGHLFMEKPELVTLVGADMTATDGLTAVLLAQSLLDMRAPTC